LKEGVEKKSKEVESYKASAIVPTDEKEMEEDTNLVQNRYEVAVKLQDLQADPNSPLYSVKAFEELGLYNPI
jgi:ATP-dependent RNA helicase DDX19/DBP5